MTFIQLSAVALQVHVLAQQRVEQHPVGLLPAASRAEQSELTGPDHPGTHLFRLVAKLGHDNERELAVSRDERSRLLLVWITAHGAPSDTGGRQRPVVQSGGQG